MFLFNWPKYITLIAICTFNSMYSILYVSLIFCVCAIIIYSFCKKNLLGFQWVCFYKWMMALSLYYLWYNFFVIVLRCTVSILYFLLLSLGLLRACSTLYENQMILDPKELGLLLHMGLEIFYFLAMCQLPLCCLLWSGMFYFVFNFLNSFCFSWLLIFSSCLIYYIFFFVYMFNVMIHVYSKLYILLSEWNVAIFCCGGLLEFVLYTCICCLLAYVIF